MARPDSIEPTGPLHEINRDAPQAVFVLGDQEGRLSEAPVDAALSLVQKTNAFFFSVGFNDEGSTYPDDINYGNIPDIYDRRAQMARVISTTSEQWFSNVAVIVSLEERDSIEEIKDSLLNMNDWSENRRYLEDEDIEIGALVGNDDRGDFLDRLERHIEVFSNYGMQIEVLSPDQLLEEFPQQAA